jgi:predicted nuclease with TOPRIM domain
MKTQDTLTRLTAKLKQLVKDKEKLIAIIFGQAQEINELNTYIKQLQMQNASLEDQVRLKLKKVKQVETDDTSEQ